MISAYKHLHWTAAYVQRHKLERFVPEAKVATQLADLIAEKINLTDRLKAQDASAATKA